MQVVSQLELQLQKERDRLQAMMQHLHMTKQQMANESKAEMQRVRVTASRSPNGKKLNSLLSAMVLQQNPSPVSMAKLHASSSLPQPQAPPPPVSNAPPMLPVAALVSAAVRSPMLHPPTPTMGGPIRRRISDKSSLSLAGGESRTNTFYFLCFFFLVILPSLKFPHLLKK